MKIQIISTILGALICCASCSSVSKEGTIKTSLNTDLCVYGASGAGISAAVAAAREGNSSIIIV